ncbi:RagB/SusD family nutrient uptake outer membrane protein [uncultured Weeksella sp.]|uniref:RagB/SusD family nutrient uptake outer membrane protein n=1 Tax=uncultured Weeksella sp. TaxID=1161389 RepID=UPI00259B9F23|nr:RagB/SusD family nutrient uptake outer membrane protein [uncultured Weeksella sp.]
MKIIKHTIKILALSVLTFGTLTSCQDELDIYSENAISPEQINKENIQFFLNGLYDNSTPIRDDYFYNDVRGGNYTWTALSGNNSKFGVLITGNGLDDTNVFSSSYWQFCYSNIYNANNLIAASEKLDEKRINAETKFIRAAMYYHLVTMFGDVPLITTNTVENLPRTPKEKVWSLIISDLDYAIENAQNLNQTSSSRVSKEAAKAFKARVLLYLNMKNEATNIALEVINQSNLALDKDYERIFRATASSTEILFAYKNLTTESNVRLSQLFWPYGTTWAGSYFVQPSDFVLNELYEENDPRKDINIQKIVNSDGTFNMIISKYTDVQPLIFNRLAEMYFIAAEGLGKDQGLMYLNQLRSARSLPHFTAQDFSSDEAYLETVLLERRRELFSEGFLFQDLVRTDKAIDLPNIPTKNHYVMPLPGSQIILSNGVLIQNDAY